MSMNHFNSFTVEETNLLSIYTTGSKEELIAAMKAYQHQIALHYSSSKIVSFISGKSKSSETVISSPTANLCNVLSLGFFVLPDIRFAMVDCVIPDRVAKRLMVIFRSLHKLDNLRIMASCCKVLMRFFQMFWN